MLLIELTRGENRLDTWVRTALVGLLFFFCLALVWTTLSLRSDTRGAIKVPTGEAAFAISSLESNPEQGSPY